ncbi:hypothetical protein GUJ93_ZPchr0002g25823 [Zizania palustris]|uniref:Uncharacterized protein n=1 Tax=Zizania palustris TaxID=103762 RepID=A0A8J5VFL9_ZIZPA|nr:hypothetical protein GUJ93_ZPchr0002g25823 [Zizania palustris]
MRALATRLKSREVKRSRLVGQGCNNGQEQEEANVNSSSTSLVQRRPYPPRRIDTAEIKKRMQERLGEERFERYFACLSRFLSTTAMEKTEFDRVVVQTIGRDNVALHNHLLLSICHNACVPGLQPSAP